MHNIKILYITAGGQTLLSFIRLRLTSLIIPDHEPTHQATYLGEIAWILNSHQIGRGPIYIELVVTH